MRDDEKKGAYIDNLTGARPPRIGNGNIAPLRGAQDLSASSRHGQPAPTKTGEEQPGPNRVRPGASRKSCAPAGAHHRFAARGSVAMTGRNSPRSGGLASKNLAFDIGAERRPRGEAAVACGAGHRQHLRRLVQQHGDRPGQPGLSPSGQARSTPPSARRSRDRRGRRQDARAAGRVRRASR